ncbi:MAG: hypothetical protein WCN87_00925 [Chlamydiota bacterium]
MTVSAVRGYDLGPSIRNQEPSSTGAFLFKERNPLQDYSQDTNLVSLQLFNRKKNIGISFYSNRIKERATSINWLSAYPQSLNPLSSAKRDEKNQEALAKTINFFKETLRKNRLQDPGLYTLAKPVSVFNRRAWH